MKRFNAPDSKIHLPSRIFIGIVCILSSLLLFAAGTLLPALLNNKTEVVVADCFIEKGTCITSEMLKSEFILSSSADNINPLPSVSSAVGCYATCDIYPQDTLTYSKISSYPSYKDPYLYTLEEGYSAISVSVDSLEAGLSDKLIPGDVVSIYWISSGYSAFIEAATLYEDLRYVKILSVSDANGNEMNNAFSAGETNTAAVTLMVCDKQAALLAGLQYSGRFHLVLAGRGASADSLLTAKASDYTDYSDFTPEVESHE